MNRGLFVVFEGCEGSGKSTIINLLEKNLNQNYKTIVTREPGGTNFSEEIRNLIFKYDINPKTEALLFAASRSEHMTFIEKQLKENNIILCDRFVDSSIVYQGYARKLGMKNISLLNDWIITKKPDLIFYLKIDPQIGLNRIKKNQRIENRFDQEKIDFHNQINDGFNELYKNSNQNTYIIDASKSINEIYDTIYNIIMEKINE